MLRVGNFKAWIVVDGEELEEYEAEVDTIEKTVTCWVPSDVGRFSVSWKNIQKMAIPVGGALFVDGMECDGHLISAGDQATAQISGVLGEHNGKCTARPFIFSLLKTTDDDAFLDSTPWDGLGEIILNIHGVELREASQEREEAELIPDNQKIHETFKHGMRHRIKLGKEREHSPLSLCRTWLGERLATFKFKYRPIDVLIARDIAPPDSPPPDTGIKRKMSDGEIGHVKEEDDSDDELKALQARMDEIRERRAREGPRKRIKTEKRASFVPGEVIDLT